MRVTVSTRRRDVLYLKGAPEVLLRANSLSHDERGEWLDESKNRRRRKPHACPGLGAGGN